MTNAGKYSATPGTLSNVASDAIKSALSKSGQAAQPPAQPTAGGGSPVTQAFKSSAAPTQYYDPTRGSTFAPGVPQGQQFNPTRSDLPGGSYPYPYGMEKPAVSPGAVSTRQGGGVYNDPMQQTMRDLGLRQHYEVRGQMPGGLLAPQTLDTIRQAMANPKFEQFAQVYEKMTGVSPEEARYAIATGTKIDAPSWSNMASFDSPEEAAAFQQMVQGMGHFAHGRPGDDGQIRDLYLGDIEGWIEDNLKNQPLANTGLYGNSEAFERANDEAAALARAQGQYVPYGGDSVDNSGRATDFATRQGLLTALNTSPDVTYTGPSGELGGAFGQAAAGVGAAADMAGRLSSENLANTQDILGGILGRLSGGVDSAQANSKALLSQIYGQGGNTYANALARDQSEQIGKAAMGALLGGQAGYNPASASAASSMANQANADLMKQTAMNALKEQRDMAELGLGVEQQGVQNLSTLSQQGQGTQKSILDAVQASISPQMQAATLFGQLAESGMNFNANQATQNFNAQMAVEDLKRQKALKDYALLLESQGKGGEADRIWNAIGQGTRAILPLGSMAGGLIKGAAQGAAGTGG